MKSITIKGSKRESVGKVATKSLRNAEKVPCVLYGGKNVIHFSAEEKEFKNLVYTPNVYTAKVDIDDQQFDAILQEIQFHPVTDRIIHVDFYQIFEEKEITMNIPVKLKGNSKGIIAGGSLSHNLRRLKIKAIPSKLPDYIETDISDLEIGDKLYITSFINEQYKILHSENTVVAQVRMSRNVLVEDEAEQTEEVEATTDEKESEETKK